MLLCVTTRAGADAFSLHARHTTTQTPRQRVSHARARCHVTAKNALVDQVSRQSEVAEVRRSHLLLQPICRQRKGRAHHSGVAEQQVQLVVLRLERVGGGAHGGQAAQVQLSAGVPVACERANVRCVREASCARMRCVGEARPRTCRNSTCAAGTSARNSSIAFCARASLRLRVGRTPSEAP